MIIDYKVIPHREQRYETVGDWMFCEEDDCPFSASSNHEEPATYLHIRVSKMSDPRYELLVFHHELTEALLCREKGVTQEQVDEWDETYEARRCDDGHWKMTCGCEITATSEPGHDMHAPYYFAHKVATQCERKMAKALEVDWAAYNDEVEAL